MQTITTKAMTKVAAVATGLAMATSMLSFAPMAHAAALTDSQVSAIVSLLQSFGADSATIANVQASLTGGTPASTVGSMASSCAFTKDLTMKSSGSEVTCLQNALIAAGYSVPAGATGYFGAQTQAAVMAWQKAAGVSPAAGYFGAKSRAAFNLGGGSTSGTTSGTTGGTVSAGTGNGLKVMLATDSPNNIALVAGQAIGTLAKFTFANPTSADIKVTNLGFKRTGVSNDSTLANVYLYWGAKRLTDSAGVSNSAFNFNDSTGLFTVPAGGTYTVSVLADIAGSTSGQQVGVQLIAVTSTGTLDSSVALPVNGYTQTVSAATLATVAYGTSVLPSSTSVNPQNDYVVWQNTVTIGTRAVTLNSFQLKNIGSIKNTDIINLRLYVDGVMAGTAQSINATDSTITWDLSASPLRLETGGRVVKVLGDIVGGSSATFQLSLRRASDAQMIDTDLNQPVLATGNGSSSTGTFAARAATQATISSGTVSVVKANNSPSANVTLGASNVKWVSYEMRASGEDIKVDNLDINAITTNDHGLDNGKVFFNGVQVGSTKDLTDATNVNFTFGSSFILKAGAVAIVDVYADAKTTTGAAYTSGDTAQIRLAFTSSSANGQGQISLTSIDVPGSNVDGNAITISSATASMTKYSGYGNQTIIAGSNVARLGSFTLSTGATEGMNVNTITVTLSDAEAATITDLMLKDNATGAQIGTTKATPSGSNSFSVNFNMAASATKVIDVYGSIKSGSNIGSWTANIDGSGTGATTGNSITFGSSSASTGTLQTITVGTGTLTAAVAAANPVNGNVIAGAASVKTGVFTFSAANSAFTVNELKVKVPSGAATSVTSVTLSYKSGPTTDCSGATVVNGSQTCTATQSLALPGSTETYATATFTGLTFYVPQNDSADITATVGVATIANSATTGAGISVVLDYNEGLKATDSAGTNSTSVGSADLNGAATTGYGTMYVKKSIPTLALVTSGYTANTVATGVGLYRFSVTADAGGTVEWKKLSFTLATTAVELTAVTLYDVTSGTAVAVNSSAADPTSTKVVIYAGTSVNDTVQSIAAGQSKTYELRGTIANWGTAADTITINFSEDTTAVASASSAGLTDNMIWSDRAATSHTTITADWTNGYLVKDVTGDTRSCQFGTVTTCTP